MRAAALLRRERPRSHSWPRWRRLGGRCCKRCTMRIGQGRSTTAQLSGHASVSSPTPSASQRRRSHQRRRCGNIYQCSAGDTGGPIPTPSHDCRVDARIAIGRDERQRILSPRLERTISPTGRSKKRAPGSLDATSGASKMAVRRLEAARKPSWKVPGSPLTTCVGLFQAPGSL